VLPAWLRWGFPPLLLLVILPIRALDPALYRSFVDGERGLIELATPLVALIAAVLGAKCWPRLRNAPPLVRAWVVLVTLACVYLAGEELSWGQHLLGWETPEPVKALNDQGETNLHNVSSWFDQKPRLALELWIIVGGIVVPLREGRPGRGYAAGSLPYWFWPTRDVLPTAILAIALHVPDKVKDLFGLSQLPLEIRYSEPQEYYFALFLALYLASIYVRAGRPPA